MAQIVLGLATSHSPQLSTPPDLWPLHGERDKRNPGLLDTRGTPVSYDELLAKASPSLAKEVAPATWQARYEACQKGIATLAKTLEQISPDILVIFGDDQEELFSDENMPAMLVYWGEELLNRPQYANAASPGLRAAAWAYGEMDKTYPVATNLGRHLIESFIGAGFDVAHSRKLKPGEGMGHAFSFVYGRLMNGKAIPTVPIMVNTYYPPNQPTPKRCYDLGRATRAAIEAWSDDARVAVIGSGGLSHFVIDEELDQQVIKAMQKKDAGALGGLPQRRLNSGTSEVRNWIAAAGAVEHLDMTLIDYVPCYRSAAGTGCAMGFAQWG
jgi:Catalytic LigB subunit of aromatic ring-opening dioxygenase